jgi:D-alanyl-D-alanine dipeptidase/carboxypeptidase
MTMLHLEADAVGRGPLILINPTHPLAGEPSPASLAPVAPAPAQILLEHQAAASLRQLLTALRGEGQLIPVSGYRSLAEQRALYAECLRTHGARFTQQYVAIPGCSEHQSGLAIDLSEKAAAYDVIRPHFPYTGLCQAFREQAAAYGFVERYPAGREAITHIAHEPWHFRYVGYPHAQIMCELSLTLEQYTDYVRQFPGRAQALRFRGGGRAYEIFFVPAAPGQTVDVDLSPQTPWQVSGNNADGFVITLSVS